MRAFSSAVVRASSGSAPLNGCIDRNGNVRPDAELALQGLPERSLPHPSPPELGPESDRHAREPGERHRRLPEPKEVARKKTEPRTRQERPAGDHGPPCDPAAHQRRPRINPMPPHQSPARNPNGLRHSLAMSSASSTG